jgi:tRNA A37 threonylcarbamoyladenosine dehydratase
MREEQFARTTRLIGNESVESLHRKTVTFVGVGAVGGFALEALVRLGVGHVRLFDFDRIEVSNLNRQILATWPVIGEKKVEVAENRIKAINPDCVVESFDLFVSQENLEDVLKDSGDLVVDAIDSVQSKCALLAAVYQKGIPVVSSMGAALRRDPFLVRTADLMDTAGCPLARSVRQKLRAQGVGRGIPVVYSPEPVTFTYEKGEEKILGSLPTITGIFGLNLAHLGLKTLLGGTLPGQRNRSGTKDET